MNLFQKFFKSQVKALPPVQDISANNEFLKSLYRYFGMQAPVWLDDTAETYIKEGYQGNANVYAIVKKLTSAASSIPWSIYEVKDSKALNRYKSLTSSVNTNFANSLINRSKALDEIEHPYLSKILHRPNVNQGWSEFIENIYGFKLLTGNGYAYGNGPDSIDIFTELWVMPSQYTIIHSGGWMDEVSHYTLSFSPDTKISKERVLHTKYPNFDYSFPGSHLYGMSPIRAANKVLKISNDSYESNAKLLQNMMPAGMLVGDDKELPLTQDQADQLRDRLIKAHSGVARAGEIPLTSVSLKWLNMGLSPVDLNIIESNKMTMRDLCNAYGVQSQLFNDPENKSYNNMQEARKSMITNSVLPDLYQIRDELNRWLIPAYEKLDGKRYFLDVDPSCIPELQSDYQKMGDILDKAWYLTGNEKRLAMNYDTIQGNALMDDLLIPMNYIPLSQYSSTSDIEKSLEELADKGIQDYES